MSEWTPERIKAVEAFADDLRPMQGAGTDLLALAEIGLAVVKADPETVDRVGRALYGIGVSNPARWASSPEEFQRDKAQWVTNHGRLALAALREMGKGD